MKMDILDLGMECGFTFRFVARCGEEQIALFKTREECEWYVWTYGIRTILREPQNREAVETVQRLIEGIVET